MQDEPQLTLEQLRALNNPVRLQVLTTLRTFGPATVGELAERLALKEHLLFYHVKVMVKHGLVFPDSTRPSSTKPVTVFRASRPGSASGFDYTDPEVREQVKRNLASVLRASRREFESAMAKRAASVDAQATLMRVTARLSPERHELVRDKLREISELLRAEPGDDGEGYSLTVVLTPLP